MKQAGKHDYEKSEFDSDIRFETFSIGVFEWIPKSGGKGVKKGPAKVRIVGKTSDPQRVYDYADHVVAALNAGSWNGKKRVFVK